MSEELTSPAQSRVAAAGENLTTLDPEAGQLTVINTYLVAPNRVEELLELLASATEETLRHVPGFLSANLHVSVDGTKIVNYAQWHSPEALAAAREFPGVAERIGAAGAVADEFAPVSYALRQSIAGAGA